MQWGWDRAAWARTQTVAASIVLALMVTAMAGCGGLGRTDSARPTSAVASTTPQAARSTEDGQASKTIPAAPLAADQPLGQGAGTQFSQAERKIIYNVFLDLTIKDVQAGFERIGRIAHDNGGFIAESHVRQEGKERRATITIRVPVSRSQDVLATIRGLASSIENERSTANDVTEEYTDLRSRQRNLEAAEAQLLVLLGQARSIQEVLQVQDRLNTVRGDIERIKGRMNLLDRLSDLATIQVQLRPELAVAAKTGPKTGPIEALQRGWEASMNVLGAVALVALTTAAFSWWLVPLAVVGWWVLVRRGLRRRGATDIPTVAATTNAD